MIGGFDPATPIVAANGRAMLKLTVGDPGNPRGYVDGQVYGIRALPLAVTQHPPGSWVNPWEFISLHVYQEFVVPEEPTWYDQIRPIFTQYGHLYPLMDKLLDLTSYEDVAAHASILLFAFGLPESDPNSMPATRDLSPAKRQAILRWLSNRDADGKPLLGVEPPMPVAVFPVGPPVPSPDSIFLTKSGWKKH